MDLTNLSNLTPAQQQAVIAHASRRYGLHLCHPSHGQIQGFIPPELAHDHSLAMDALPSLVTVSNSGIPAFFTNYIEPSLIEVLVAPNEATNIMGESKKGNWAQQTAFFAMVEVTGETSAYGDRNTNGQVGTNVNWPQRQQYLFQTMSTWGDLEMARAGEAQIDWAAQINRSSGVILRQTENKIYFYGVAGLQNYGILNDPGLTAPISPNAKTAGGFTWLNNATYLEIVNDVNKLYAQLVTQTRGLVKRTDPMKLCMSPEVEVALSYVAQLGTGISVFDTLKKTYPKLTVESAPQYATGSGQLVQLKVESMNGQKTGECSFSEKMRAHGIVRKASHYEEKKSAGCWGTIFYNYAGVAQMLGV